MATECIGKNKWRIGYQVRSDTGKRVWVRKVITLPDGLTLEQQKEEAVKALRQMEAEHRAEEEAKKAAMPPPVIEKKNYTVQEWARLWLETEIDANSSAVTASGYRYLLESRILPSLGACRLSDLSPIVLTNWMTQLRSAPKKSTRLPDDQLKWRRHPSAEARLKDQTEENTLSEKTLLNYYICMESMLSAAVRLGLINENPMKRVSRPGKHSRKKQTVKYLSDEDAVDLLRCLKDEPNFCYRVALLLALLCGLRLGEVGGLMYSDVDWDKGTIDISRAKKYTPQTGQYIDDPKTASSNRIIKLPAGMMVILHEAYQYTRECARLAPAVWKDEGWIVHAWNGAAMYYDTPSKWFRRFADKNGFRGVRFHDLRHAHASILLANGLDVVSVAHRMGHSDPSVTLQRYAHAFASKDDKAASTLHDLFGNDIAALGGIQMPTFGRQTDADDTE